jgi:hypothetical protein
VAAAIGSLAPEANRERVLAKAAESQDLRMLRALLESGQFDAASAEKAEKKAREQEWASGLLALAAWREQEEAKAKARAKPRSRARP